MRKKLFFTSILALFIDAYIEFIITGYLNTVNPLFTFSGEIFSSVFAYVTFSLNIAGMPLLLICILMQPISKLLEPAFHEKWGVCYENLKHENKF